MGKETLTKEEQQRADKAFSAMIEEMIAEDLAESKRFDLGKTRESILQGYKDFIALAEKS